MDAYGTLFLRYKGKKIATAMTNDNLCQQVVAIIETSVADKWARDEWKHLVTPNSVYSTTLSYINDTVTASKTHGLVAKHIGWDRRGSPFSQ